MDDGVGFAVGNRHLSWYRFLLDLSHEYVRKQVGDGDLGRADFFRVAEEVRGAVDGDPLAIYVGTLAASLELHHGADRYSRASTLADLALRRALACRALEAVEEDIEAVLGADDELRADVWMGLG